MLYLLFLSTEPSQLYIYILLKLFSLCNCLKKKSSFLGKSLVIQWKDDQRGMQCSLAEGLNIIIKGKLVIQGAKIS